MGVTGALSLIGTAASAIGSIQEGNAKKDVAEINAQIYEAQARNIETAKKITAEQYRTRANVLRGEATASAARAGLKISGTTANSISQSIMQLQMDNSYEQYNLAFKKYEANSNAALERYKGIAARNSGFVQAGATALTGGADYYNKYWKGTNTNASANNKSSVVGTWFKGQANKIKSWGNTKLSGGLPTTNKQMLKRNDNMIV